MSERGRGLFEIDVPDMKVRSILSWQTPSNSPMTGAQTENVPGSNLGFKRGPACVIKEYMGETLSSADLWIY